MRLEFGLPADAIPLTRLPMALNRGQYLALVVAGCTTPVDVKELATETLTQCVGAVFASQIRSNRSG